ncbi:ichor-like [Ischnura elegans]|uniref:ichor-like n=1 Tax=Ischnura elegans TaxID=197161 RepID=UPI001ED89FD7|nr:ichor-like [Ischnura elegans]
MKFETDCGPVDALLSCWGGEAAAHHGLLLATSSAAGGNSVGPLGSVGGVVGGAAVGQSGEEGLQQHHLHYTFAEDSGPEEVKQESDCASAKATMDVLDSLLLTTSSSSPPTSSSPGGGGQFAELKPLPPFHTYTASLNGIYAPQPPRHHDQAPSPHSTLDPRCGGGDSDVAEDAYKGTEVYYSEPVVVSSSGDHLKGVSVVEADQGVEYLLPPDIEDIAAIIGNAIADTTVPGGGGGGPAAAQVAANGGGSAGGNSDGWMDLDAWIDTACVVTSGDPGSGKAPSDALNELASQFAAAAAAAANQQNQSMAPTSTLQSLLNQGVSQHQQHHQNHITYQQQIQQVQQQQAQGGQQQQHQISIHKQQQRDQYSQPHHHMPLLQSRLQNGAGTVVKMEAFTVEYDPPPPLYLIGNDMMPHTTHGGSPPGLVQSTTAESPTAPSSSSSASPGRFPTSPRKYGRGNSLKAAAGSTTADFGPSLSDPSGNVGDHPAGSFPAPGKSKSKSRSKSSKSNRGGGAGGGGGQVGGGMPEADGGLGAYPDGGLGGGKEKPVHRCGICNRGFLNKSNIKVHLRTHTGEKPFRCDTCGKAFRQKAHLIKHQQIHKRVGRD